MKIIRWGILGTGRIAQAFAQDLCQLPNNELMAVGAESLQDARQFAAEFSSPHAYGSYDELVADPEIDIIYIVTPVVFHKEHIFLCLKAGKPVLVEKPFSMTAIEARQITAYARSQNLFCMEAMWMRFIPAMQKAIELLKSDAIGDIYMISASLGFYNAFDPQHQLFDPALGGGAILDMGIYPLSLIYQLLGEPSAVSSQAHIGASGVDEQTAVLLGFPDGQIASLSAGIRGNGRNDAFIMGTRGTMHIHTPLYRPTVLTISQYKPSTTKSAQNSSFITRIRENPLAHKLYQQSQKIVRRIRGNQQIKVSCDGHGYGYEAAEAARCLQEGLRESPVMPLDETIAIMMIMDTIRNPNKDSSL